ncbi:MAG: 23S rRNA (cytosine(1962)-C(5))-methyltransferase [uncultured Chloroflexi bacterium]|uniref:23S rRNA (Cytosine(1962)-C(5))-methyltransferase n=1 Tax=uncultured Chloroflexota bacterium TaxID=166587 RepID=A0A6J4ISN6_9CHLR|nr:MAG: 23S rRNA (cytosine(1962)-C(5))-methyltransferase [uncultured Chloroflexota bacterium]
MVLKLREDRAASSAFRHPWVFSGALATRPDPELHGRLVHVAAADGRILGTGTYSANVSIAVRLFEFGPATIDRGWLARRIAEADARRRLLGYGPGTDTTGYRVVFGESDGLPGLVLDRFGDVLVFQLSTAGMDALREDLIDVLLDQFQPQAIVERSDVSVRREEGLNEVTSLRHGEPPQLVPFREHGVELLADVLGGQKTGFYLDQKDLRLRLRALTAHVPGAPGATSSASSAAGAGVTRAPGLKGARVLNLFAHSGSTGLAALLGGAASVHNVDSSAAGLELCRAHADLHGLGEDRFTVEEADIFQWLTAAADQASSAGQYDIVLLDPPALIKSQRDAEQGRRAYHFLNRAAIRLVRDGGLLVTSSCSSFFKEDDFAFELRRATVAVGVTLHHLETVRQSADHPPSIYFPEAMYLKTLICQVTR